MSTTTPEKVRSVPKPVFTDAEAGAREFPSSTSRHYNYFVPARRRATVYEDVTVDVQPDPERHLSQGWLYGFANGVGGYPHDWTKLKSSNWHEFLDPNEEWEQTIYRNNANVVRQVQQTIANAKAAGSFLTENQSWLSVLERHVSALAHVEHGIGMYVYTACQRDAPTNMINNAIAVAAAHKLRFAQDLILCNLEVSEQVPGFDGSIHKAVWQSDPAWQPTRENVEQLTGTRDWAEAFFATAIVFEPLVGELFRSHLLMQVAAVHGDYVTPTVIGVGEADVARDQAGARRLFSLLANDPVHGAANRAVMEGWLASWVPRSIAAGRGLQPIWSQLSEKVVTFDESATRAKTRFTELLTELGLTYDKEL